MNKEEYVTIKVEAILELLDLGDKLCDHELTRNTQEELEKEWLDKSEAYRYVLKSLVNE